MRQDQEGTRLLGGQGTLISAPKAMATWVSWSSARALLAGVTFVVVGLAPAPAPATERQELAYTVYFGPFPALDVTTDIEAGLMSSKHYRVEATVAPQAWIHYGDAPKEH